jgi:hypothetical protein
VTSKYLSSKCEVKKKQISKKKRRKKTMIV